MKGGFSVMQPSPLGLINKIKVPQFLGQAYQHVHYFPLTTSFLFLKGHNFHFLLGTALLFAFASLPSVTTVDQVVPAGGVVQKRPRC